MGRLKDSFHDDDAGAAPKQIVVFPARAKDLMDIMRITIARQDHPLDHAGLETLRKNTDRALGQTLVAVAAGKPDEILGFGVHAPGNVVMVRTGRGPREEGTIKALIRGLGLQAQFEGATRLVIMTTGNEPKMDKACAYYDARPVPGYHPSLLEITNMKAGFARFDKENRGLTP